MNENNEVEILLVEDNASDAELTIRALEKNNLVNHLIHLKNGAEAIDFIFGNGKYSARNRTKLPRVVLLDLKMPKLDGIDVLKKLKSVESTKKIPVVILTSSKEDPDVQKCYELGANSYIIKPVQFDAFLKAVTDLGLYWMLLNQPPPEY